VLFYYSEMIAYCHAASRNDKIARKYRKTANIIETKLQFIALLTAILHCFIHWKQQILSSTLTFWQGALCNNTFIIFAVFDVRKS